MADGHHRMMEAQMALSYFHVTSRVLSPCAQSNHHVGERNIHLFETSLLIMWIKPQQWFLPWYNLIHKHPQKWSPRIVFQYNNVGKKWTLLLQRRRGKKTTSSLFPKYFLSCTYLTVRRKGSGGNVVSNQQCDFCFFWLFTKALSHGEMSWHSGLMY